MAGGVFIFFKRCRCTGIEMPSMKKYSGEPSEGVTGETNTAQIPALKLCPAVQMGSGGIAMNIRTGGMGKCGSYFAEGAHRRLKSEWAVCSIRLFSSLPLRYSPSLSKATKANV